MKSKHFSPKENGFHFWSPRREIKEICQMGLFIGSGSLKQFSKIELELARPILFICESNLYEPFKAQILHLDLPHLTKPFI